MRTKGEIAYSKIYGQYFYTIGAIKDMLNANAKDCTHDKKWCICPIFRHCPYG